jgi:hypothetical protein
MPTVANGEAMKFLSFAGDRKRDLRKDTKSGFVQVARWGLLAFVASHDESQPWNEKQRTDRSNNAGGSLIRTS